MELWNLLTAILTIIQAAAVANNLGKLEVIYQRNPQIININ